MIGFEHMDAESIFNEAMKAIEAVEAKHNLGGRYWVGTGSNAVDNGWTTINFFNFSGFGIDWNTYPLNSVLGRRLAEKEPDGKTFEGKTITEVYFGRHFVITREGQIADEDNLDHQMGRAWFPSIRFAK